MTVLSTTGQDVAALVWRKSSYSNDQGGNCVEVAEGVPGLIPVRDSKDPAGPVLIFSPGAWLAFVTAARTDEFQPRG